MLRVAGFFFLIQVAVLGAGGVWLWSRLPPSPEPVDWRPIAKGSLDEGDCLAFWDIATTAALYLEGEQVKSDVADLAAGTSCWDAKEASEIAAFAEREPFISADRGGDVWFLVRQSLGDASDAWRDFEGPIPLRALLREALHIWECDAHFQFSGWGRNSVSYHRALELDVSGGDVMRAVLPLYYAANRCADKSLALARRFADEGTGPLNWRAVQHWVTSAGFYPAEPAFVAAARYQEAIWTLNGRFDEIANGCPGAEEEGALADRRRALVALEWLARGGHAEATVVLARAFLAGEWVERSRIAAAYYSALATEIGRTVPADLEGLLASLSPAERDAIAKMREDPRRIPEVPFPDYSLSDGACSEQEAG